MRGFSGSTLERIFRFGNSKFLQITKVIMTDIFPDYTIRPVKPAEWKHFHFIWELSQDADDPAGRPPDGWWFLGDWAETGLVFSKGETPVALAALKPTRDAEAAEVRLA